MNKGVYFAKIRRRGRQKHQEVQDAIRNIIEERKKK